MLTYPKSTKRVRRMPMHLSSGHVTLMPGKFSPLFTPSPSNFFQSDLGRRADSRWALPQISSFLNFFSEHEISEMRGPTDVKFCMMVSTRPNFIMPVQNFFGGRTPKKFRGRKTCKIWPDFGRLRSSAANISKTDEDIQNWIVIPCMAIPPALGETSTANFGPVTLEI